MPNLGRDESGSAPLGYRLISILIAAVIITALTSMPNGFLVQKPPPATPAARITEPAPFGEPARLKPTLFATREQALSDPDCAQIFTAADNTGFACELHGSNAN